MTFILTLAGNYSNILKIKKSWSIVFHRALARRRVNLITTLALLNKKNKQKLIASHPPSTHSESMLFSLHKLVLHCWNKQTNKQKTISQFSWLEWSSVIDIIDNWHVGLCKQKNKHDKIQITFQIFETRKKNIAIFGSKKIGGKKFKRQ